MANNSKQWQTKSNNGQQWQTMVDKVKQWQTKSNNGKQSQTMANEVKQWQTKSNNAFTLYQGGLTTCPVLVSDPANASVSAEELPT